VRGTQWRYEPSCALTNALVLGPEGFSEVTLEMLQTGWLAARDALLESCRRNPNPAWRPWGWWAFEAGEPQPNSEEDEAARLAQLGELREEELSELEHRAMASPRWRRVFEAVR
jgi:hypothetical protein